MTKKAKCLKCGEEFLAEFKKGKYFSRQINRMCGDCQTQNKRFPEKWARVWK